MTKPKASVKKVTETETPPVIAYKGFSKDWTCHNGFKFEVGKTYEHVGLVQACEGGFHACENPFDVWPYYWPFESKFAIVELSGELSRHDGDDKIAAAKIHIKAELSLPEFITMAVERILDATVKSATVLAKVTGLKSDNGKDSARIGSSGNAARIGFSGYAAQIGSSGDAARIECTGENAVVAAAGYTRVKGADGAWVSLAEYDVNGKCVGFATGCIGRDGLEPDVWYCASGGKLVKE